MTEGFYSQRSGRTARAWEITGYSVKIKLGLSPYTGPQVTIDTTMDSAGGGMTDVQIVMRPKGFNEMVRAMYYTDREALLAAMAAVMHEDFEKKASAAAAAALVKAA